MVSVRRAVILVAQILALVFIVVATAAGALAGEEWLANSVPLLGVLLGPLAGTAGVPVIGALAGFFVSTVLAAMFFLLVEIADNTRNPFNG
ncbi:MAG TPA: hypothetical protein VFP60_16185 [Pseudolabrys sp.]|nr:hypothetical protein [Pseudolabrys sp.]